jgi:hypothetical protein
MGHLSYLDCLKFLETSMMTSRPISHAQRLRLSLFLAAGLSATAGCSDKGDEVDTAGSATSGGGSGGEGGDGGDDGGSGSDLTGVPEADYPVCSGGDTGQGGFEGPCCVDVYCIDAASDGSCLSTTETNASEITGIGLGSGSCECEAPAGPYAPYDGKSGDCCYTVGVQGCEGRPLIIAGNLRTAPLQRGRSWRRA